MSNLAQALPAEIARVSTIRGHFEALRGTPNVVIEPQIIMMTAAIDAGVRACGEGDVLEMLRAFAVLKDFDE